MPFGPSDTKPDESIYGTAASGQLPWKQRQIHELSVRAREAGARKYERLPSVIVSPNRLQNLVSSQVEELFNKRDLKKLQEYEFAHKPKHKVLKPLGISPEELAGHIINIFGEIPPERIDNEVLAQAGLSPAIGQFQLGKVREAYAKGMANPTEPPEIAVSAKRGADRWDSDSESDNPYFRGVPKSAASSAPAAAKRGADRWDSEKIQTPMSANSESENPYFKGVPKSAASSAPAAAKRGVDRWDSDSESENPYFKGVPKSAASSAPAAAKRGADRWDSEKIQTPMSANSESENPFLRPIVPFKPNTKPLSDTEWSSESDNPYFRVAPKPAASSLNFEKKDTSRRPSVAEVFSSSNRPSFSKFKEQRRKLAKDKEADEDTFDIAKKEIRESLSKKHVEDALPRIDRVNTPALHGENADIINAFKSHYGDMGKSIRDETAEHYLRNVAPKLNYQYMQGGRWNSPSRGAHQNLVLSELHKNMDRDLTKLNAQGFEKAIHEIGQHKSRRLASEELAANLVHREKEQANVGARNLADVEKSKLLDKMARIGAAKEQGVEQHLREKERLLEDRMQQEEYNEHPWRMIERETAIAQGLPAPAHLNTQRLMENMRPNIANTVGTGIGNLAMMGLLQNRHKAGGLVGKYAPGGFVMPKVQMSPEEMQMQQQAQEMQNHNIHGDPAMHAIARLGFGMAARPRGQSPGEAHAHASMAAMDTLNQHRSSHQNQKERGMALMQQIQQSRLKQQQVIAEFEHRNKQFEASQATHNASLAEQKRHHMAMEGNAHSKVNSDREVAIGGKTFRSQQKLGLSPQDQAQARKNDETLAKLESREAPYDETLEFLSTNTPSTGWIAEHTPDISDKSREYQRKLSSMVSSVVAPGVMTKAKLDFAKQQKPSQMDSPEAVKEFAAKGKKVIEEDKEPLMLAQQYRTYGIPDRITLGAYNAWLKNDKQGEFDDYLSAVLEGRPIPQHDHESASSSQPTRQQVQAELKKRGLI